MPFYYSVNRPATTNGTPNTCSNHVYLLSVANQANCFVVGIMANIRNSVTAGSGVLRTARLTGAPASGTALVANKRNPDNPTAATTPFGDASAISYGAFSVNYQGIDIGFAQTGGQGGWVALERDHAVTLKPNGGANGNVVFDSFTATASQALQVSVEFGE